MYIFNTVSSMLTIKHYLSKNYNTDYALIYKGMYVKVVNDTDENNGIYQLLDPYNSSYISSWKKIEQKPNKMNNMKEG